VQFSREIEVLHLAPMTSIGLPDPASRSHKNRTPYPDARAKTVSRPGGPDEVARWTTHPKQTGSTEEVVIMPRNNPSGKPNHRLSDASPAS